nr:ChrR family anti-sigma-E factor [Dyella sp. 2HG41-7]
MPHHHLDESTLMGYSAGALSDAFAVVVAAHLSICSECRQTLRDADAIGGLLLAQQQETSQTSSETREAMLAKLTSTPSEPHPAPPTVKIADDGDTLPTPLHPYFGQRFSELHWKTVAPGMHLIRATNVSGGNLMLLRIAPGKSVPMHSHGNNELTMILRGSYADSLGHFAPGDVADLDSDITHQPVTLPGVPCICVAATDAPLRFEGWVARVLQPLIGL